MAGVVCHLDAGVDHDVTGFYAGSVAAGISLVDLVAASANRDRLAHHSVGTDRNFVASRGCGNGGSTVEDAMGEVGVADSLEVRISYEVVPVNRALSAEAVVLAHNLRRVEALSEGSLVLQLSEELLAGIRGVGGNGESQGGKVLNLECLGIIGLAGDRDDLVVLVQVEELDLLRQVLEGGARPVSQFLVGARKLQAFGLALVGDLHGFLCLLLSLHFVFLVNLFSLSL